MYNSNKSFHKKPIVGISKILKAPAVGTFNGEVVGNQVTA